MYELKIDDDTRRYIGDMLCAMDDKTMPISGLSEVTGISRVTLTKWTQDARRLWWLTKHIRDDELSRPHGRRYYTHDSRFFDHAHEYCQRVRAIRADALAGLFGSGWQREERERKKAERGGGTP